MRQGVERAKGRGDSDSNHRQQAQTGDGQRGDGQRFASQGSARMPGGLSRFDAVCREIRQDMSSALVRMTPAASAVFALQVIPGRPTSKGARTINCHPMFNFTP